MKYLSLFLCITFCLLSSAAYVTEIPHLEKRGNATQLIVDGKPFLALAGELHNSSSSSLEYMKTIWTKLARMHLNTVLAAVPWDLVEPEEGKFDFTLVDGLIKEARNHNLRLILLWFGSWKNGLSHYVPDWVKSDYKRFPRVRVKNGTLEILSTLCEENIKSEIRAYTTFMRHIRKVDEKKRTVIMIQMQNEVGLHADSRDRSELANIAFSQKVPSQLMDHLVKNKNNLLIELLDIWRKTGFRMSGTWEEVFGTGPTTEEFFMAWNYARYCNGLTVAGKKEYSLPVFVNGWLVQPQDEYPGEYPSGGPQPHVLDIWRAGAPDIDIYAPDIYLPNFEEICTSFTRSGNALFIPESRAGMQGAAQAFLAIGQFNAIGYSPFGIDSRVADPVNGPIPQAYNVLEQIAPLILEHQTKGTIVGVSFARSNPSMRIGMGEYEVTAGLLTNRRSSELPERGYGIIIQEGPDRFLVAGAELQVTFATKTPGSQTVGLATVEEGVFENGQWVPGRTLNGDDIMISYDMAAMALMHQTGTGLRFRGTTPKIQRVKLYRFE